MSDFHDLAGEKKAQILVLCDQKGNVLGTATRQECHQGKGKTHLAFIAYILDKDSNLILTKRGKLKTLWPLFWDASVVSHILPSETPQIAAKRRAKEELALEADFSIFGSFYYHVKQNGHSENEYCFLLKGITGKEPIINPVEIKDIKKVSADKFRQIYSGGKNRFTPWFNIAQKHFPLEKYLWPENTKHY